MAYFVGLDVSVKETSVCVVDDAGSVILEQKVPTETFTEELLPRMGERPGAAAVRSRSQPVLSPAFGRGLFQWERTGSLNSQPATARRRSHPAKPWPADVDHAATAAARR